MDESVEKSCWGVTMWAVAVFGGVLALAFLFGGFDAAVVVASTTQ